MKLDTKRAVAAILEGKDIRSTIAKAPALMEDSEISGLKNALFKLLRRKSFRTKYIDGEEEVNYCGDPDSDSYDLIVNSTKLGEKDAIIVALSVFYRDDADYEYDDDEDEDDYDGPYQEAVQLPTATFFEGAVEKLKLKGTWAITKGSYTNRYVGKDFGSVKYDAALQGEADALESDYDCAVIFIPE